RSRDQDDRGDGRRGEPARPPAGLLGPARPSVRLLHPGNDHAGRVAARPERRSDRRGDPGRHRRQPAPRHRLREHREIDPARGIDASGALKVPGVLAVVTGKDLEGYGLHWMPTLAGDMQMVLPPDTVMYQAQEVAAVIATSRYAAADGVAAVLVDYEPLPVIVDPFRALEEGAVVLRPDRAPDKQTNRIWHWESGDKAKADAAIANAD